MRESTAVLLDAVARETVARLRALARTVATAESLTGGMLGAALTSVPGASVVYRGGVVAYAPDLKHQLLGVDDALLAEVGAVDPRVAEEMARGVRTLAGADYGLAVTGVAGPDPQDGHPAGTVWLGLADASGAWHVDLRCSGDREAVRTATTTGALLQLGALLDRELSGGVVPVERTAVPVEGTAAPADQDAPPREVLGGPAPSAEDQEPPGR